MKSFAIVPAIVLAIAFSGHAKAEIVASNNFDSPFNLTGSTSSPIAFNGFASAGDAWGIYDYNTGGPFALFDDSLNGSGGGAPFPTDSTGIVQSTKTDKFFGISDTVNPEVADGMMTATFSFDISSATGGLTRIDIDFAGMGDFEDSDVLSIGYSIDGGSVTNIFASSVDTDIADVAYTMESGNVILRDDPMSINGVQLSNSFQTISADVSGTGSSLTLEVMAATDGGSEAFGFDNIIINGVTAIPEPSSALFLGAGLCGLVTLRRRRNG